VCDEIPHCRLDPDFAGGHRRRLRQQRGAVNQSDRGPVAKADSAACAANRRTMESSLQQYSVLEGKSATSLQQLVPKYLQSVPSCPSGGTYSLQGSRVSCSIHGS